MESIMENGTMDDANADANNNANNDANTYIDALCPAERHYREKGYKTQILFVMCIGLKDSTGAPLIDLAVDPCSKLKKTEAKPNLKDLIDEIGWRSLINTIPRCSNWHASICTKWLTNNPIVCEDDVNFLVNKCTKFKATIKNAGMEQQYDPGGGIWRSLVPYLHLILCLLEDDIKEKYLEHGDTLSPQELDGQNLEQRDPTVYEMIADRWNSNNFNPTLSFSKDYRTPVHCSYQEVSNLQEATCSKAQNCSSSMLVDLIHIIQNWERSGQGDYGILLTKSRLFWLVYVYLAF